MISLRRIKWYFFTRLYLSKTIPGFKTSLISYCDSSSTFEGYNVLHKGTTITNSSIGRFTYFANTFVYGSTIGRFCSIGPETIIGGLGAHPTGWLSTHPTFYSTRNQAGTSFSKKDFFDELKPVNIGNDVWIGARVTIMDGINIGNGAIIATGAIVTKDVKPYSIVGGIPAKHIRYRHNQAVINNLEEIAWWNWPIDILNEHSSLFRNNNIDESIDKLKKISEKLAL